MKFKEGKTYRVNGGGEITITKRTRCFVTFNGDYEGKKKVYLFGDKGIFGLGEHIMIPAKQGNAEYFCFAKHEEGRT